jgi:hypothetical protein
MDLDRPTKSMIDMVEETVKPAHYPFWFREPPGGGRTRPGV